MGGQAGHFIISTPGLLQDRRYNCLLSGMMVCSCAYACIVTSHIHPQFIVFLIWIPNWLNSPWRQEVGEGEEFLDEGTDFKTQHLSKPCCPPTLSMINEMWRTWAWGGKNKNKKNHAMSAVWCDIPKMTDAPGVNGILPLRGVGALRGFLFRRKWQSEPMDFLCCKTCGRGHPTICDD